MNKFKLKIECAVTYLTVCVNILKAFGNKAEMSTPETRSSDKATIRTSLLFA